MRIVMMTNTYKPIIGGLEKSVESFSAEYKKRGHDVIIVAPEHRNALPDDPGVIRVPALQNFNGTDFSVAMPLSLTLSRRLDDFQPQLVHSHHPFLIGDTALRVAAKYKTPLIFTYHTLYEENTHYVPLKSRALKPFAAALSVGYANLCDYVFAPSESIARMIKEQGCKTPVEVVATGIYPEHFARTNALSTRDQFGLPENALVIGHVGRIAPEKNIAFLSKAVLRLIKEEKNAFFFVVGKGPALDLIKEIFHQEELSARLISLGSLEGPALAAAYQAMDVFAFASHSETQGLVLIEAMAAGVPVVAVDAPGVREVVKDRMNGRLIAGDDEVQFAEALKWCVSLAPETQKQIQEKALYTAGQFSMPKSAQKALSIYEHVLQEGYVERPLLDNPWRETIREIKAELQLVKTFAKAAEAVVLNKAE